MPDFLDDLLEGLSKTEERYGYPSCPCRMATGIFNVDRDIICPCDYRDTDVQEHGACYCSLYVDDATFESKEMKSIPERRPMERQVRAFGLGFEVPEEKGEQATFVSGLETRRRLFFCKVCGYVTFRDEPPYVCPICRAKQEMFSPIAPYTEMRET